MSKKTRKKSPKKALQESACQGHPPGKPPALHRRAIGKTSRAKDRRRRPAAQSQSRRGVAKSPLPPRKPGLVGRRLEIRRQRKPSGAKAHAPSAAQIRLGRGRQGARLPSAARRRQHRLAGRLCREKAGAVLLSARGHAGLHQGGHRFHAAGERTFAESQTAVLGVSADPPEGAGSLSRQASSSPFLWSRMRQHEMLEAYGVWGEKSMYGRTFHGHSSHHGSDRRRWPDRQDLAPCQGRRPCRRGAGGGPGAIIAGTAIL